MVSCSIKVEVFGQFDDSKLEEARKVAGDYVTRLESLGFAVSRSEYNAWYDVSLPFQSNEKK